LSVRMVLSLAVRGQGAAVDGGAAGGRNIGRRSGAKRTRQVARRRVRAVRGARKTQRNTGAGGRGAAHRPRMQQRVGGDQHRHPVLRRRVALAAPGPAGGQQRSGTRESADTSICRSANRGLGGLSARRHTLRASARRRHSTVRRTSARIRLAICSSSCS